MQWLTWAPGWGHSAGVRVLHRLTHLLNMAGESAYITATQQNPEYITPHAYDPTGKIMIYPEIASSNPYQANDYLIYGLNAPGAMGGDRVYNPGTCLIGYHDRWEQNYSEAISRKYLSENTITIGLIDPVLYSNHGKPRTGPDLFWIYKGAGLRNQKRWDESGWKEITLEWPGNRAALAEALNSCYNFYSYDRDTALLYEAFLCGCRVFVPGPTLDPLEWFPDPWELGNMVAKNQRDLEKARRLVYIYEEYRNMKQKGSEFFVGIYTNECKQYCDEAFFKNLRRLVEGYQPKITIVDNSAGDAYFQRLCRIITDLDFKCKVDIEHIEVSRADQSTLFQRNVTESLELLQAEFMTGKWEYFITLETDVIPQQDIFHEFKQVINKADIIGGIYYTGFHSAEDLDSQETGLVKTHHVLSGCTLYKRHVLDRQKFRWSMENIGAFPDAWMSYDAGINGFVLANCRAIKCDHLHKTTGGRGHGDLK